MDIDSAWRHMRRALAAAALTGSLLALTGCALVASWPAVGDDGAVNDPNVSPMPKVIAAAMREVVRRYPLPGDFVVNLPEGLEISRAERIAREIGPGARIVDAETQNLPVYHVTKVWVRGDRAEVDIVRPLDEPQTWQRVTVHLRYSVEGWNPFYVKVWPMGMATPGSLYGWLAEGAAGDPPAYAPGDANTIRQDDAPPPPPADNTQMEGIDGAASQTEIHQTIEVKEGEGDGAEQ